MVPWGPSRGETKIVPPRNGDVSCGWGGKQANQKSRPEGDTRTRQAGRMGSPSLVGIVKERPVIKPMRLIGPRGKKRKSQTDGAAHQPAGSSFQK